MKNVRLQPICTGLSEAGELIWDFIRMERWQEIQLFRKQYQGDFGEQWMWFCLQEAGMDWPHE